MQSFRTVLCGIVQGRRQLALASEEEVQDLATALENCTRGKEWNTVGEGFPGILPGSELLADRPDGNDIVRIKSNYILGSRTKLASCIAPGVTFLDSRWEAESV